MPAPKKLKQSSHDHRISLCESYSKNTLRVRVLPKKVNRKPIYPPQAVPTLFYRDKGASRWVDFLTYLGQPYPGNQDFKCVTGSHLQCLTGTEPV
jgi:hypothetical protein